jgi:Na+/melibiose symporter-like transporter
MVAPAGSLVVGLAQAALIDLNPGESLRTMARWTLLGAIGDFLSPLTVAIVVSLGFGWTALCWIESLCWLAVLLVFLPQRLPKIRLTTEENGQEKAEPKLLDGLKQAVRDPELLRWAALALIPTMVDEIFLSFVTLYLRDAMHVSEALIGVILTCSMVGSIIGLLALDRLAFLRKIAPERLLLWLSLLVLVGIIGLLAIHVLWFTVIMLFLISLGAAGWYPIAKAQAYARFPGRSGLVRAVCSFGAPLEIALPGIVGLVAGRFGVIAGVGVLGTAPLLTLLLLAGSYRKKGKQ